MTAAIVAALNSLGREELSDQFQEAIVERVAFDPSANAGYIRVEQIRPLNIVEQNIIKPRHGETIGVGTEFWVNIDVDNFGRLSGIEILSPGTLKDFLERYKR